MSSTLDGVVLNTVGGGGGGGGGGGIMGGGGGGRIGEGVWVGVGERGGLCCFGGCSCIGSVILDIIRMI